MDKTKNCWLTTNIRIQYWPARWKINLCPGGCVLAKLTALWDVNCLLARCTITVSLPLPNPIYLRSDIPTLLNLFLINSSLYSTKNINSIRKTAQIMYDIIRKKTLNYGFLLWLITGWSVQAIYQSYPVSIKPSTVSRNFLGYWNLLFKTMLKCTTLVFTLHPGWLVGKVFTTARPGEYCWCINV